MRTNAREVAFKVVFASRFTESYDLNLKSALCKTEKLNKSDIEYLDKVLEIVSAHEDEFSKIIDGKSSSFPEARLFHADKSILLIALAEILYMKDVPNAVSANEAANIASKYSTEKSASFVSGVLAGVIKDATA